MANVLLDALSPARLGKPFRWLLASATVNNIGDGIGMAAGPLLVASQTQDPLLVAMAGFMRMVPQVLFGLQAGALADRRDRKRQVVLGSGSRVLVLIGLIAMMATGRISIGAVLVIMFLLGMAEVVTDSASRTLMPAVVPKEELGTANQRIMGSMLVTNQLLGPPVGAALFAIGMIWPFSAQAICTALGLVLILPMMVPPTPGRDEPTTMRQDIREGLSWLWHHPAIRTLTIIIVLFNITWGAPWGVLVLWAHQRMGLDSVGYGLMLTASAVGGVLGTLTYGWFSKRFSGEAIMKVCLSIEVLMHLSMATITWRPWAFIIQFVFGCYAFLWGTLSATIRQRAVPLHLQGRVGSLAFLGTMLGMLIGWPLGGMLARWFGITGPNWFAFIGAGLTLLVLWPQLRHVADAGVEE